MKISQFMVPQKLLALKADLKEKGIKRFIKEAGWKLLVGIFLYYLIRDTILYIIIPIMIARGIIGTGCG